MRHRIQCPRAAAACTAAVLLCACTSTSPQVTDDEVRREYDRVVAQAYSGKEYDVRHILVQTRGQAEAGLRRIKSGEPFAQVAMDLSADPGSNQNGGELGWILPDHFVPEFSRAMVSLDPSGMTAEPVPTRFGWHIIEVTRVRNPSPPPFDEVKDRLAERLRQGKARSPANVPR
ncbi:peptidylprolyl isomerase [Ideonella sp.]|uniref:peptidylprolyl isomerase n=1 Tax=Ideonella sp. TaxID=1929293 RepID=UPI0035B3BC8B